MHLLETKNLYKEEKGKWVINNINLSILPNQKIGIVGSTGSGKTTLLKMIAGFIEPTKGDILFKNRKVVGPLDKLIPGHSQIAYLSQHFELRTNYKVTEVLEMANKITEKDANQIYRICKIEHLFNHRTDQLSGGEKQRIALATQLIAGPTLLLLDEPYSNLDIVHKTIIKEVINEIIDKLSLTCIMISHDPQDILSWADKVYIMQDGFIIQSGTPVEIYKKPLNEYCAAILGRFNIIDTKQEPFINFLKRVELVGGKVIIRPEQFKIESIGNVGFIGYIKHLSFYGSYYLVEVSVGNQVITINTQEGNFIKGQPIFLSFDENEIWHIL